MCDHLTLKATHTDPNGKTRTTDLELRKDTVAEVPVIVNRNNIDDTNKLSYVVEGTGEAGARVLIYVLDARGNRAEANGTVDAEGRFAVPVDTTRLLDGPVRLTMNLYDRAGNATSTHASSVTVQKTVDATLPAPSVSTEGPLTRENAPRYHVWGTYEGPRTTFHTGIVNEQGEDLVPYRSSMSGGADFDHYLDMTGLPKGTYNLIHFITTMDGKTSPVTQVQVVKDF